MRKFARIAAAGSALMASFALLGPQAVQAQTPVTNRVYTTGLKIQNLSDTATAAITLNFYAEGSSTAVATVPGTIPAKGSVTYAPLPTEVPSSFKGSAIISSDQPVAAVVNIASPNLAATFGGGGYTGFTAGAKKFFLPLVFREFFTFSSFFSVQNIGDSPTTVTVDFVGTNGAGAVTKSQSQTIQPNTSFEFNQDSFAELGTNFTGAATITSTTEDVVAAVMQVSSGQILGYGGFAAGATNPVMPIIQANRFGYFTGANIQNVGTAATDVTVTFSPALENGVPVGTECTETITVQPGAKVPFAQYALRPGSRGTNAGTDNCADGVGFLGSGRVTGNTTSQPLVAAVNQLNSAANKGGTYGAFDAASATASVVFPTIQDRLFGYFTGFSVVNVGTVATPVTCTFSNSQIVVNATLEPGKGFSDVQGGKIAPNYNGSATCTATASGAKIVGVGQQLNVIGNADTFFVYEGISK